MTGLIINYYLHSGVGQAVDEGVGGRLLGVERFEGINEKLLPSYDENGHKVSVTKFFEGYEDHRWLVKGLVYISTIETSVYLEPWKSSQREEFLSQTKKSNHTVIGRLHFGTLVEVEFGFIPRVRKLNGDVRSNKRYPDTVHNGEMHKRRLCIVVKADNARAQVVPLTSQAPESPGDRSLCPIGAGSLSDLVSYNDPTIPSYAICRMIKTVAHSRILPPLSKQRGATKPFRDNRYSKKLNSADRATFKQALSHAVGLADYYDVKEKVSDYYRKLEAANHENENLAEQVVRLTAEQARVEAVASRCEALLEIMIDWRRGVSEDSLEQARAYIETELTDYMAILSGD
ncbi:MAG: type II toxin-antitoxin system PemK/MazF family toxin [Alcanivorax sp.]|nr:type II toxin-antitoxin system PemK/MazF family toxin [Alcanivorax sp.]